MVCVHLRERDDDPSTSSGQAERDEPSGIEGFLVVFDWDHHTEHHARFVLSDTYSGFVSQKTDEPVPAEFPVDAAQELISAAIAAKKGGTA